MITSFLRRAFDRAVSLKELILQPLLVEHAHISFLKGTLGDGRTKLVTTIPVQGAG